jgi:hypothetical protein
VISVQLARDLRDAGLRWDNPAPGDRFIVADRNMDDQVFVLSDMTVDVHEFPTGRVIGFNGTVEWALDSVEHSETLWLPSETQLRDRLGGAFVALEKDDGGYRVAVRVAGTSYAIAGRDPDTAYGRALLFLITGVVREDEQDDEREDEFG